MQGVEIGSSNWSLQLLPVVVRTVMHSLVPVIMLAVATVFGIERDVTRNARVWVSLLMCSAGGIFLCMRSDGSGAAPGPVVGDDGELLGGEDGEKLVVSDTAFSNVSVAGMFLCLLAALLGVEGSL